MQKQSTWLRYIDDIFAVWPHGEEKLQLFVTQINLLHPTIKFTSEWYRKSVTFLDSRVIYIYESAQRCHALSSDRIFELRFLVLGRNRLCYRVLARIGIPSGSWAWWVGVATRTMTSSIEYLGTFAGENFLNWLQYSISRIKTFVDCRPHAFPVANNFFESPPTRFLVPRTKIRGRRQYREIREGFQLCGKYSSAPDNPRSICVTFDLR